MAADKVMEYTARLLSSADGLAQCPVFRVENAQWNSTRAPETFGRMGILPRVGILVWMCCMEANPLRRHRYPMDRVCEDSAMEAFFAFPQASARPEGDSLYLNFEVNANGALYAKSGHGRQGRQPLTDAEFAATNVRAEILPDYWWAGFTVPFALLRRVADISAFQPGDVFYCNFYKISEDPAQLHFISYSPLHSPTPDFHRPQDFARAKVIQIES